MQIIKTKQKNKKTLKKCCCKMEITLGINKNNNKNTEILVINAHIHMARKKMYLMHTHEA